MADIGQIWPTRDMAHDTVYEMGQRGHQSQYENLIK